MEFNENIRYDLEKLEVGPDDILVCYLHVEHVPPSEIPDYMNNVSEGFKRILPDKKIVCIGKHGNTLRTTLESMKKSDLVDLLNELTQ